MKIREAFKKIDLPIIPADKANHFIYGFYIYILLDLIMNSFYAALLVLVIGIAKEAYDYYDYGKWEIMDVFATVLPSLILILIE